MRRIWDGSEIIPVVLGERFIIVRLCAIWGGAFELQLL